MVQFNFHANFIGILFLILLPRIQDAYCLVRAIMAAAAKKSTYTQPLCVRAVASLAGTLRQLANNRTGEWHVIWFWEIVNNSAHAHMWDVGVRHIINTSLCGSFGNLLDLLEHRIRPVPTPKPDARRHLKYATKLLVNWNKILRRDDIPADENEQKCDTQQCVQINWLKIGGWTSNRWLDLEIFYHFFLLLSPNSNTSIEATRNRQKSDVHQFRWTTQDKYWTFLP